jgi:hypothetical protein
VESCAVAPINDTPNPFADGVRLYALDANKANQLWTKSEEWIRAHTGGAKQGHAAPE